MTKDSFYDSEDTLEDTDLKINTTANGIPDIVPFATLETGHYLGLKHLFEDTTRQAQMYCLKGTHLLVLDRQGLQKVWTQAELWQRDKKMDFLRKVPGLRMLHSGIRKNMS